LFEHSYWHPFDAEKVLRTARRQWVFDLRYGAIAKRVTLVPAGYMRMEGDELLLSVLAARNLEQVLARRLG
jgi:hypothetical protein